MEMRTARIWLTVNIGLWYHGARKRLQVRPPRAPPLLRKRRVLSFESVGSAHPAPLRHHPLAVCVPAADHSIPRSAAMARSPHPGPLWEVVRPRCTAGVCDANLHRSAARARTLPDPARRPSQTAHPTLKLAQDVLADCAIRNLSAPRRATPPTRAAGHRCWNHDSKSRTPNAAPFEGTEEGVS